MTVPVLAFFSNTGGVGTTSLVYHLAWMYAELGRTVVAVDLDPQAHLTSAFLDEKRIEDLWRGDGDRGTINEAIGPVLRGAGDVHAPARETIGPQLHVIPGSLALSSAEDDLAREWPRCLAGEERAFRVTTAFRRCVQLAAEETSADVALVDLGPNLGAINRAVLITSDYMIVPVAPDLFSIQGLRSFGPALRRWRQDWNQRVKIGAERLALPDRIVNPAGYVVLEGVVRLDRPAQALDRWMADIPFAYAREVLGELAPAGRPEGDFNCLGMVKPYGSLMPLSREARKPIFRLKASDGALGAHAKVALDARRDFEALARRIAAASWDRASS